ncbi:hypothetical protein J1N35_037170 [Gossypium stocksii]|uniref:Uncharacterized protein n=1 Tax=Gossypium stocksii TaxID=47602 RepID=A0A9D3UJ59_9ROSI|nr:hypothetical protein J1N35_037170 [Gossypium stocksii]
MTLNGLNQVLKGLCIEGSRWTISRQDCYTVDKVSLKSSCKKQDAVLKRSLQKNFTKPMLEFPKFPKELQVSVEEETGEVEPTKTEPTSTKPAVVEKDETQGHEEEADKTEMVNIATDHEGMEN